MNLQRTGLQGCKLREACLVVRSPSGLKQHIGLPLLRSPSGLQMHAWVPLPSSRIRPPLRGSRPSPESRGQHAGGLDNQAPAQHSLP